MWSNAYDTRAGVVNYYEELGVREDTSVEEIRQGYRKLARLLHPDGHTDEVLKISADRQMQRLNEMLAILTDPSRRQEYDLSLHGPMRVMAPDPARPARVTGRFAPIGEAGFLHFVVRNSFWILIGTVLAGCGLWLVLSRPQDPEVVQQSRRRPSEVTVTGPAAILPEVPERTISKARKTPAAPSEESVPLRAQTPPQPSGIDTNDNSLVAGSRDQLEVPPRPEQPPAAQAEPPQVPAREAQAIRAVQQERSAMKSPFVGNWFYVPEKTSGESPGLYPPEYMEFVITKNGDSLLGQYRARFRVSDLAVSPEVIFRATGRDTLGNSATLQWFSSDGAKGDVQLTPRSANSMDVVWWTKQFGRRAVLTSGTALMIRQLGR